MQSGGRGAGADAARLRVLSDAVRAFADASVDPARLLETVAKIAAESLGCFCSIGTLSRDGRTIVPAACYDFDPEARDVLYELAGANPLPVDAPLPSSRALATGEPVLVTSVDAASIAARFRPEDRARAAAIAPRSFLVARLAAHDETIGLLSFVRHGDGAPALDEQDAALGQCLADHAALAIANARALDETRRATGRLRLLSDLARELAGVAEDYDALLPLVAKRLGDELAALCVIRLVSADGATLEPPVAVHHPDPEMVALARGATSRTPQRVGEGITGRVAATGRAVLVPVVDPAKLLADLDPERRDAVARQGITSLVVAPLVSHARVIGVASLSRSDASRPFDEDDLRLLEDVSSHAALAITHARSFAAQRASEEAHRLLFEESPLPLFVFDVETMAPLRVNDAALRLYGYTHEEFMRLRVTDLVTLPADAVRDRLDALGDASAAGRRRYRRKDGSELLAEYTTRSLSLGGRRARIAAVEDVTERAEAEGIRASLAAIVQSSNDAIVGKRLDGTITSFNPAAERLFGYAADEIIGGPVTALIPPDRLEEERALIARVAAGAHVRDFETARRRKDGVEIPVSISISPIFDASGRVVGASKTAHDLTEQRAAAQALRRTEEQLRHAQKMEAVGRLAGGVAHDFNNMLTVILSYASLIGGELEDNDPIRADVEEITKAATRASELTRQLLVFSRRQLVEPRVIDLAELLGGMQKMLKRILGEDVELAIATTPSLGRIRVDVSSVEQAIMNLVVNARDAMPTGGQLTIETRDVVLDDAYARAHLGSSPGPHVMLAVTDSGVGIDAATQARIFEPFFTTKEPGKGTGLGLSTVFGIAQQCGGSVWVYSEVGRGTTFKLYFPRVEAAPEDRPASLAPVTLRGSETILLVEDQEQVRAVAEGILQRAGYRLIVAENAGEALLLCESHPGTIHLLLTDVVMPRMSGAELARRIAVSRPDMRVLCMSGYTDDSIVRHGVLESGIAFLQKPFTPDSLTRKVREVLNAPVRAR